MPKEQTQFKKGRSGNPGGRPKKIDVFPYLFLPERNLQKLIGLAWRLTDQEKAKLKSLSKWINEIINLTESKSLTKKLNIEINRIKKERSNGDQ